MSIPALPLWPATDKSPTTLHIFRCDIPAVTEQSVRAMAERFTLGGGSQGVTQIDDVKITYSLGPQAIAVYRASGGLRYQDRSRWQVDNGRNVDLRDDEATDIARRYVEQLDLVSGEAYELAKVTRLRVGVCDPEGANAEERIIDLGVIFQRVIDGLPVDGPGGKVMVYIDADGEVTGVDKIWRTAAEADREVEALQPREWLDERLNRYWHGVPPTEIAVDAIRLGYFEDGWRQDQRYLQPAYVVIATLGARKARSPRRRSVYVAPAATNDAGEIMRPRTDPVPQSPRRRVRTKRARTQDDDSTDL